MTTPIAGSGRPDKYLLADGTRVPGTTTIIGRFKDSGALLHWAFKQGKSGAKTLYEASNEAADVGTLVHDCIEADIHGRPLPDIPTDKLERVRSALAAWDSWKDGRRIEIVATEMPYVSEQFRFGGTIDAIAREQDGRLSLLDWKSSNAVYSDYLLQLAAYKELWDENNEEKITGGFHLVRFSKEHGDMEHRYWPELADAWTMFMYLSIAYQLDKLVAKRAK